MNEGVHIVVEEFNYGCYIRDTEEGYGHILWPPWAKKLGLTHKGQKGKLVFIPDNGIDATRPLDSFTNS